MGIWSAGVDEAVEMPEFEGVFVLVECGTLGAEEVGFALWIGFDALLRRGSFGVFGGTDASDHEGGELLAGCSFVFSYRVVLGGTEVAQEVVNPFRAIGAGIHLSCGDEKAFGQNLFVDDDGRSGGAELFDRFHEGGAGLGTTAPLIGGALGPVP